MRITTVAGATEERIAVLFAHQADGKQATLFQVENHPARPGDGVAYPRKELAHGSELRGLALAIELTENTGRRWWAWMDDHATGAGVGRGRFVSRLAAPVAHGLHGASLGPVGWQLSNDGALFVALGAGAGGHVGRG